jgi:hypothetical protein
MEEGQIVLQFFSRTDQQKAKAVEPGMCALHYPAAGFEADFPFESLSLFVARAHMGGKTEFLSNRIDLIIVVPFSRHIVMWHRSSLLRVCV